MNYRTHHTNSSGVAAHLRQDDGVRGAMRRKGVQPRDHHRENILRMREMQKQKRVLQEAERNAPIPRNDKYAHVKSKVKKDMTRERVDVNDDDALTQQYEEGETGTYHDDDYDQDYDHDGQDVPISARTGAGPMSARSSAPSAAGTTQGKQFLQRGASAARLRERAESKRAQIRADTSVSMVPSEAVSETGSTRARKLTKPPVPSARDAAPLLVRKNKDFIRDNMTEAVTKPLHPPNASKKAPAWVPQGAVVDNPDEHDPKQLNPNFGKVPKYVRERVAAEEQKRREEAEAARLAAECPPGMQLMPEEERVETLAILKQNKLEIEKELGRMPIVIDTHSMRKKKAALEKKVDEIESALTIFSRSKVFITAE